MTLFGIGPRLLGFTFAYAIIPTILSIAYPGFFTVSAIPPAVFNFAGIILLAAGVLLWLLSLFPLLKGFTLGKLCTTGAYSIVRNPMYSAFIVFIVPAVTMFFRSWLCFTIPLVMALIFRGLIKEEEASLEECFGEEWLKYKSEVNALIPSFKSFKLR